MTNLRGALLIIRAWVEPGSSTSLRADIRLSADLSNGLERTLTVTSPEAGAAIVKKWLEDVVEAEQVEEAAEQADGGEPDGWSDPR